MADQSLTDVPEQTHDAMRAAAMRPVTGPAVPSVQAAGGGLDVPGREPDPAPPALGIDHSGPHEPIPGAHDRSTLTHREPGAIGGAFNGADVPADDPHASMDERTIREHVREGGGLDAERRLDKRGDR